MASLSFFPLPRLSHDGPDLLFCGGKPALGGCAQGCKDIGNLMEDQNAAAGCYVPEVLEKCPVSCVGVRGNMCYDGTPPVPRARSRDRVGR